MKLRRAATTLLLAGAIAAAPAVATAYEADEYEVGVSTTTPSVGQTFTVTVGGPAGNPTITLTIDRKSTRLNSSHVKISYAVFCLKKKKEKATQRMRPMIQSSIT